MKMAKESIEIAVKMVGQLLEHHGTTGPFVADSKDRCLELGDPRACKWCLAGAIEEISLRLGFCEKEWQDDQLTEAVNVKLGTQGLSRVLVWEGAGSDTTLLERMQIARKLQE